MRGFACFLFLLLFVLASSGTSLSPACAATLSAASWRYKMTVTVDTPEGPKTRTTVREIRCHVETDAPPAVRGLQCGLVGQAVVVDLGKRGLLFGLMQGVTGSLGHAYMIALKSFPDRDKTPRGVPVTLSIMQYPRFVSFKSPGDPKSVQNVIVSSSVCCKIAADRTEELFGKGVAIKSVTLEVTDDPASTGIETILPWLPTVTHTTITGDPGCIHNKPPYICLGYFDFERK